MRKRKAIDFHFFSLNYLILRFKVKIILMSINNIWEQFRIIITKKKKSCYNKPNQMISSAKTHHYHRLASYVKKTTS